MPRRALWDFTCEKCGKKFQIMIPDAITPKYQEIIDHPLCTICKIKEKLKSNMS
jgi:hypothetical protein